MPSTPIESAYQHCLNIAQSHYENFPVASRLLPKKLRRPIAAIYAFARRADDIADEGDLSDEVRLQQLECQKNQLKQIEDGHIPDDPIYIALADAIQTFQLPMQCFYDLLSAFKQDIKKKTYEDFDQLLHYCRRSANPIGQLLLHLVGQTEPQSLAYSDAVCSALQLINFYQDLQQDFNDMQRIYIPQNEMKVFNVDVHHFKNSLSDKAMQQLMLKQISRAKNLLISGAPLGEILTGRLGFEIRLVISAAFSIIHKLEQQDDLFSRPRLSFYDWLLIFGRALFFKRVFKQHKKQTR